MGGVDNLDQKRFAGFALEEPGNLVKSLLMETFSRKLEILSGVSHSNFQLWTSL